jgi:hypothetical protein
VPGEAKRPGSVDDPGNPTDRPADVLTVEGIFDEIQAALDEGADRVEVDYDPETGRPRRVDVDWIANAIDDETGIRIDRFEILDGDGDDPDPVTPEPSITGTSLPPEAREVATADLSVHHGCGFGFFVGNPEQTVALRLSWQSSTEPTLPGGGGPITLPNPDWAGEVLLGADLYANWCDDVLEPDEPRAEVTDRWPVTAGTITFTSTPEPGQRIGCGMSVGATVQGLEVEAPDGSIVGLPDLEVVNESWGCVAG